VEIIEIRETAFQATKHSRRTCKLTPCKSDCAKRSSCRAHVKRTQSGGLIAGFVLSAGS
jgi:hypothetical protein